MILKRFFKNVKSVQLTLSQKLTLLLIAVSSFILFGMLVQNYNAYQVKKHEQKEWMKFYDAEARLMLETEQSKVKK